MTTITERLTALREKMREAGYAACLITTDDYHMSEYGSAHFKTRRYFSGFTGSAGTLVVLGDTASLWTDGRYFLQAEEELSGSGITLFKMGLPGTPTIAAYLAEQLAAGDILAFDGRTVAAMEGLDLARALQPSGVRFDPAFDPAEGIWTDRPGLPEDHAWVLSEEYAGKSAAEKIAELRAGLSGHAMVVARLDEIAWLLNMRGSDIPFNPVFLAFLILSEERADLFIDEKKLSEETKNYLLGLGISLNPYDGIYQAAAALSGQGVFVDLSGINYLLCDCLQRGGARVAPGPSPLMLAKAVKNSVEIENTRKTHVADGVAMVRFMKWLKEQAAAGASMTEVSAARHLDELRYAIDGNLGLSFPTISGYGYHGAIIHYDPTEETDIPLEDHGLLLVDSGGQYYGGTTDITRTFAMGPLTEEEKRHFALVLRCMLQLMQARFPAGVCFENLDVLARMPLWEEGLDFLHGTGHGVGHLLNVHEGPNRFHWRPLPGRGAVPVEPGMVTTDEPGVYIAGSHGIRLENELLCVPDGASEYGDYLAFESLTLCPIDLDAVEPTYLSDREIGWLNEYHRRVYETLAPHLSEEERRWLADYTRPIAK